MVAVKGERKPRENVVPPSNEASVRHSIPIVLSSYTEYDEIVTIAATRSLVSVKVKGARVSSSR